MLEVGGVPESRAQERICGYRSGCGARWLMSTRIWNGRQPEEEQFMGEATVLASARTMSRVQPRRCSRLPRMRVRQRVRSRRRVRGVKARMRVEAPSK